MINDVYTTIKSNIKVSNLFKTCPLEIIDEIEVKNFRTGEFKLLQGSKYEDTYVLVSGKVKVYLISEGGKEVVLDIYGSGMLIGEQEAIIKTAYSASILNITPVVMLKINNHNFRKWLSLDHVFANNFIYNLSEQLYHLTKRTERYSLHSALEQTVTYLMNELQTGDQITRKQLEYEVDTSYRNINRILQILNNVNAIQVKRGNITILDQAKLYDILRKEE
ncbi:MAG: Crp/Fnr family transcriptional regulator [Liquorilactobacillus nagelii]|jgi:CRP-like cAMP-binding protein|uniref:Crp/Fnr family transcriptional regulator n=1 Tax=Liquorilactobacillus nagelii TaxID=82688 RepID=UPI00242DEC2F|nr:Crp/Fnr family transcriptional regulator [Liquorilactobacillus nagelii]MCI1922381.1 Crp/Fnr family transcriptional regulator [Liquorilactobacillus nagelii]MCI1976327.1 Crp/Fnr family transcriptional regulator [Liquorilactobacillus nagelii]